MHENLVTLQSILRNVCCAIKPRCSLLLGVTGGVPTPCLVALMLGLGGRADAEAAAGCVFPAQHH